MITPTFLPTRGGTEQIILEIAKRFAKTNKIYILTPKLKGSKKWEVIDNIEVYRFPFINLPILNTLSSQISLGTILSKFIKKNNIDIIHMFHTYQLGGIVIPIKKRLKIPLITSLTGWDTYDPIKPIPKLFNPYISYIMNNSEYITTMCDHMIKSAKKQGCKNEIIKIPHGTNMFNEKSDPSFDIRKAHNIKEEDKIVLSIQRLYPRKGMEYLIRAIPEILTKTKNIKFLIGGKGPEKERLERLSRKLEINENIIFTGFIPDNRLKNYYEQSDLFTLPSLYEGFGIVYVDSLACGLPIVTTKCGGPEDIISNYNGKLVPTKDSKALSNAISSSLHQEWNKSKIIKESKKYKWENIIKKYNNVYKKLGFSIFNGPNN